MMEIDPVRIVRGLRMLEKPEVPLESLPGLGLADAVQLTAKLLEMGPPAIGLLGLDPGRGWYPMVPDSDVAASMEASVVELDVASLRIVPNGNPRDRWIALVFEGACEDSDEVDIDPDDRFPDEPDISTYAFEGTEVSLLHNALLRRAKLVGVPALRAAGVLDEKGLVTLGGLLYFSRGIAPPVPPGWTIVVERYDANPHTVSQHGLGAALRRTVEPPLSLAIDAIVDDLSVDRPFLHRDSTHAAEALREILSNAVVHRCYRHALDEPITVSCYPDRVVVFSPGCWLEQEDEQADSNIETETNIPNPGLHALMARLGLCRQQGLGLDRTRLFAKALGMRLDLEMEDDGVLASLVVDRQLTLELDAPGARRGSMEDMPASIREERVMAFLQRRKSASKKVIAMALGIPEPSVAATLKDLLAKSLVTRTEAAPRSPKQRYRVVKKDSRRDS